MKQAATRELFDYWRKAKGARAAPERGDLDPSELRGVLADTFVVDVDAASGHPLRLCGARVSALFDRECRGRPLLDWWRPADAREIDRLVALVCDEAAAIVAGLRATPVAGDPVDVELMLLPLRHHGKTHARALGSLALAGLPSWLGLLPARLGPIASLRVLGPLETRALEAAETRGDPPGAARRRGHLWVYAGGRPDSGARV